MISGKHLKEQVSSMERAELSGVTNPGDYGKILSTDMGWTIDSKHMEVTNNAFFMHCLPVRRNMIVSDDVIESERSIVIPRLPTVR